MRSVYDAVCSAVQHSGMYADKRRVVIILSPLLCRSLAVSIVTE